MANQQYTALDQVHILLALIIAVAYIAVPFTTIRLLAPYLPLTSKISGTFFFLTCAITHLALAAGFHDGPWMVVNDLLQAVAVVTFIVTLSRMVSAVMRRRHARHDREEAKGAE